MFRKMAILIPVLALAGSFTLAPVASAACGTPQECAKQGVESAQTGSKDTDAKQVTQSIVNLLLFITGTVAVIMIVIGGIKYVTSAGDASQAKSAKDTILYSVIGLIVAILAYAVVTFIINAFVK
jgi:heme/copper-type cytochrome/quinol oxidase subunit 2